MGQETKQNKGIDKKTLIIGIVIGILVVIIGFIGICYYEYVNEAKILFKDTIDNYNTHFEENANDSNTTYLMSGDWGEKEVILKIKKNDIEYIKDLEDTEALEYSLKDTDMSDCFDIINSIKNNFDKYVASDLGIHYKIIITDKNDMEMITYTKKE